MAVRTPVYYDGTSIREVSADDITNIKKRCIYLWGGSRSVNLSYVSSGGNLQRMLDTRDKASAVRQDDHSFLNPASVTNQGAETQYQCINQSTADGSPSDPGDANNRKYPLYLDGTSLRAMTKQDMLDTFIGPAIDILVESGNRDGIYTIHDADTLADHTRIGSVTEQVFINQEFNKAFHGLNAGQEQTLELLPSDGSGATRDNPTTITDYYLFRANQGVYNNGVVPTFNIPLFLRTDNDMQSYTQASIDTILSDLINWAASSQTGYRIRYEIGGTGEDPLTASGQSKGEAMIDTTLNGSAVVNDQDGADLYFSQRFPAGSSEIETTYVLRVRKE